jgi:hypothetical protein
LNRLELTPAGSPAAERYNKIAYSPAAIDELLVARFLGVPATDTPLHGKQEARFFHSYYNHYCYLPLYIFLCPPTVVCSVATFEPRCKCREPQAALPGQTVGIETDCSRAGIPRGASLWQSLPSAFAFHHLQTQDVWQPCCLSQ